MFKFLNKIFDTNQKTLDQYQKIVAQINALEPEIKALTDKKLAGQTEKFKEVIAQRREAGAGDEVILDEILPEAFATVREASRRVIGLRHFDVQILAALGLHKSHITEQKTGEGNTLTVTMPLYLNALLG